MLPVAGSVCRRSEPRVRTGTGAVEVGTGATVVGGVGATTVVVGAGEVTTGGGVGVGGDVTTGGAVGVGAGRVVPGASGDGDTGVGGAVDGATKVNASARDITWLCEVVNRTTMSTTPVRATAGDSSVSRLPKLLASTTPMSPNQT